MTDLDLNGLAQLLGTRITQDGEVIEIADPHARVLPRGDTLHWLRFDNPAAVSETVAKMFPWSQEHGFARDVITVICGQFPPELQNAVTAAGFQKRGATTYVAEHNPGSPMAKHAGRKR